MIIFIILFIYLLYSSHTNNKIIFYFSLSVFTILVGFRGLNVGVDTEGYYFIYEDIGTNGYHGYPEVLYGYLNYFFYQCGFSFFLFQWGMSILTLIFISKVVRRNSPHLNFSLFVLYASFFIFYSMNVTRQLLAVAIVLYAYSLLYNGKKKLFVLWVLIAFLFHYSAIISLVAILLQKIEVNKKIFWGGLLTSIFMGLLLDDSVLEYFLGPYAFYLESESVGLRSSARLSQAVLLSVFWSSLCMYIYSFIKKEYRNSFWFKLYLGSVLLNNMTLRMELGLRIVMYLSITQIILFPIFWENNNLKPKSISIFVILTFLTVFFLTFLLSGSAGVTPYKNVLFE